MFDKIDFRGIIRDHLATLQDNRTQTARPSDYIVFFCFPIIISVFLVILEVRFDEQMIGLLITSLSIFAALLFNLLLLVYDIVRRNSRSKLMGKALHEIYSNISFSIMICLITVILLILTYLFLPFYNHWDSTFQIALNTLLYWLLFVFILTLFMILKRIHILLNREIGDN